MSYEPGTLECRYLIEAKDYLLSAIKSLSHIDNIDPINKKLLFIYKELDEMHDTKKIQENEL